MNNQYFLKDKKCQVYRKFAGGQDAEGFETADAYYPIADAPIWCYSRQLSEEDIFAAQTYGTNETRYFVLNYTANIKIYDFILYRGTWYRVTRTDTTDDYTGDLFVYVENAKGGWLPKDSELSAYDASKYTL
jgi:SPP1 family predicted phage head-tail adaptor